MLKTCIPIYPTSNFPSERSHSLELRLHPTRTPSMETSSTTSPSTSAPYTSPPLPPSVRLILAITETTISRTAGAPAATTPIHEDVAVIANSFGDRPPLTPSHLIESAPASPAMTPDVVPKPERPTFFRFDTEDLTGEQQGSEVCK